MAEFFSPVCTVPFEIKQESHFCGLQEFLWAIPSHQKMVIFPEAWEVTVSDSNESAWG